MKSEDREKKISARRYLLVQLHQIWPLEVCCLGKRRNSRKKFVLKDIFLICLIFVFFVVFYYSLFIIYLVREPHLIRGYNHYRLDRAAVMAFRSTAQSCPDSSKGKIAAKLHTGSRRSIQPPFSRVSPLKTHACSFLPPSTQAAEIFLKCHRGLT